MGIMDNLGDLVKQAMSGQASPDEVDSAYDRVSQAVPQDTLSDGISHTFKSDQTPPFEQMVGGLFGRSNPEQKAGLLNQILGALGPGGVAAVLGSAGGALAGMRPGMVTPQQAEEIPPQTVEVLAQHAARKDPTIVDRAAGFYAQHPTLVKALGAGALALLMSRISSRR